MNVNEARRILLKTAETQVGKTQLELRAALELLMPVSMREFQDTRAYCDDLGAVMGQPDLEGARGFTYMGGGYWIAIYDKKVPAEFGCVICNSESHSESLQVVEQALYEYASDELEAPVPAPSWARQLLEVVEDVVNNAQPAQLACPGDYENLAELCHVALSNVAENARRVMRGSTTTKTLDGSQREWLAAAAALDLAGYTPNGVLGLLVDHTNKEIDEKLKASGVRKSEQKR